jgi:hypothetical protein
VDSCFVVAVAYLKAAQAGAVQLPLLAALVAGMRYTKVPLLADLCQDIVEALRCTEWRSPFQKSDRLA